jgi:hypothetical protein
VKEHDERDGELYYEMTLLVTRGEKTESQREV